MTEAGETPPALRDTGATAALLPGPASYSASVVRMSAGTRTSFGKQLWQFGGFALPATSLNTDRVSVGVFRQSALGISAPRSCVFG